MKVEYTYILNRSEVIKSLRYYLWYIYAPWLFMDLALATVFAAQLALQPREPQLYICGFFALVLVPVLCYFRYINAVLNGVETLGQLEQEHTMILNDHELTSRSGKNTVSVEYRKMKYFFRCGKRLFLTAEKDILCGTICLEKITGRETELIACLRADGVKELRFWDFRRWWRRVLVVLIAALLLSGTKYFIDYSRHAELEWSQTERE